MPAPALAPRPRIQPPGQWRFPVPDRLRLGNGMTVLLHHLPGQHVATITCHLGIPLGAEPDGCDGIAAVAAACLGPATASMTGALFEQHTAAHSITWQSAAGVTGPVITVHVPAARLPAALDPLRRALAEPGLNPAEVTRQAQLAAAALMQDMTDPQARVMRELPAAIYGQDCRAGRPADGTPDTVARLTPGDVARFRDTWLRPAAVTIVIAGDLGGLDAAALASEAFTAWDDPRPVAGTIQPWPMPRRAPAAVLADQPGAAQTQILLAAPVPGRGEPGWNELQVAACILGAPVTGLLDAQVRERSGHSYGIRATVTELAPGTGLFTVSGAVGTDATISALRDILTILTGPAEDGFGAREHATAAETIIRTLPLAYQTPDAVADITAGLAVAGLRPDYPDLLLEDIAVLLPGHITSAYRGHIGPDRLTLITAGDARTLAGPLQELAGTTPLQVIGP
jgi:predicted Zn-dependent peptidase